jgi:hypothetical protein
MTSLADVMTMKTTWTLAVSAVTALTAGTAVAAAAAEPNFPAVVTQGAHADAPPTFDLANIQLPPFVGDTVPADAVDATRDLGLSVYVSPSGDGSGVVIDPSAPLPDAVTAEIDAVNAPRGDVVAATSQFAERTALREALDAADSNVLVLYATPTFDADGTLTGLQYGITGTQDAPLEFATSHGLRLSASHDHVVATWGPFLAANPYYALVDTTTLG